MRLIFCGTPEFAVPSLRALLSAGHEAELVVTQPDRAAGRGLTTQASAVKQFALQRGLRVSQPERLRSNVEFQAEVERVEPDAIVVVAYGRLIPGWMLNSPPLGCVNVHGSLLPRYRGAAPIQWAIANGETTTGVTTMRLNEGLDTGPMLLAREVPVPGAAMAVEIFDLLAEVGAELLVETLAGLADGTVRPVKQDEVRATLAPVLSREDGRLDARRPAPACFNRWRAFYPWPGAHALFRGKKLVVHGMRVTEMAELDEPLEGERTGELVARGDRLFLVCGGISAVELLEVQVEGKRRMPAAEFIRGYQVRAGERLG